jgi:hypothetical protein
MTPSIDSPTRQLPGLGPAAGIVPQHNALAVPGHLPHAKHRFDERWHANHSKVIGNTA